MPVGASYYKSTYSSAQVHPVPSSVVVKDEEHNQTTITQVELVQDITKARATSQQYFYYDYDKLLDLG